VLKGSLIITRTLGEQIVKVCDVTTMTSQSHDVNADVTILLPLATFL